MKVLWFDESKTPIAYSREFVEDVYKFIFCETSNEQFIVLCSEKIGREHKELYTLAKDNGIFSDEAKVVGAGQVCLGYVGDWNSTGFSVTTPDRYRSIILEATGLKDI